MFVCLKKICFVFGLLLLTQCSGSSDTSESTTTTTSTTEEDDLASFVDWSGYTWGSLSLLIDSSGALDTALPVDCSGGGTIEESADGIDINDCIETVDSTTYLTRGTYSVTESTGLVTHEWEQDVIINSDDTFSTTGSISFNSLDSIIAFDFSATFASGVFRITGIVSDNSDDTSDLTITVSEDGETWLDCTYDNADLSSLTQETIEAGCSDNDDSCATLNCSNDFECQLYADDDETDEFTTSNSQCVTGCCAVVAEEDEDSSCDSNTVSCTTDFECQQFADDDQTDEFETNNVECSSEGCCALTE